MNGWVRPVLRYRVYHHCRTEGWVVRSGYQFGADWGLYKLGPAFHHATYMVRVEAVDRAGGEAGPPGRLSWRDLLGCTRVAASVRKELLVARVAVWADRRDWASPRCLAAMAVTLLRLRRWLPGEARWLEKPGVPALARPAGGDREEGGDHRRSGAAVIVGQTSPVKS
jgi:tRNA-splicing endonuclease subunit Sen2